MNRESRKKSHNIVLACSVSVLLAMAGAGQTEPHFVRADEFSDGISADENSDISQGSGGGLEGGGLFEDTGEDVQNTSGVSMDDLQQAMKAGDTDALRRYADAGALTGPGDTTKGSGIGSGAYRGMPGESGEDAEEDDEDDDSGKEFNLDDDPDAETELVEKAGSLDAADGSIIEEYLHDLAGYDSVTGSDGELIAADYIMQKMESFGYTVQTQSFHEGTPDDTGVDRQGLNILAERGADSKENRKKDIFLIVTHYDNASDKEGNPFAEDKTGVCALLEAGRILSSVVTDTDICFVFLSGEEDGLYGAANFVDSLSDENKARVTGVLDVERVGYYPETANVIATADGLSNSVGDRLQTAGLQYDYALQQEAADGSQAEDGGTADGSTLTLDDAEGLTADEGDSETETEFMGEEIPESWSYIQDQELSHIPFADASLTAAALTQYFPQSMLDEAAEEETEEDTIELDDEEFEIDAETEEEISMEDMTEEDETEEDFYESDSSVLVPDADLIAEVSDILAQTIAGIMDPNS